MKKLLFPVVTVLCLLVGTSVSFSQSNKISVKSFDKVIVSPYIEVAFVQGTEEAVTIEHASVDTEKINVKVKGSTLRVYLDHAKTISKRKKVKYNGYKHTEDIYNGTMAKVTITYKDFKKLSFRGEERCQFTSALEGEKFRLKVYGETDMVFNEVKLEKLRTTIYGDNELTIKSGTIAYQKYTSFGESRINAKGISNSKTKITSYGESTFNLNVEKDIKVSSLGETDVRYSGEADLDKGILIGENTIKKE